MTQLFAGNLSLIAIEESLRALFTAHERGGSIVLVPELGASVSVKDVRLPVRPCPNTETSESLCGHESASRYAQMNRGVPRQWK